MSGKNESGQAVVILAIVLVAVLAFAALAIDAGNAYTARREAQNAADAAAMAATRQLVIECGLPGGVEGRIRTKASELVTVNQVVASEGAPVQVWFVREDGTRLARPEVGFGALPCGCDPQASARGVEVVVNHSTPSFLAGILGQSVLGTQVTAQARYAPIVSPDSNVYPVTRCDPTHLSGQGCLPLNVGQITPLRLVDYNGADPGSHYGNFGWLSWGGAVNAPTARVSMTPPGTYHNPDYPELDYFNPGVPRFQGNTVKWDTNPDPNDHELTINKWVQGATGNMATIKDELEQYWVNKDRTMIIPLFMDAVGRGQNSGFLVSNFAAFKVTCANLGGPGQRLGTCQFLDDFPNSDAWIEGYFLGYVGTGATGQGCTVGGVNSVKLTPVQ